MYKLLLSICLLAFAVRMESAEVLGVGAPTVDLIIHVNDDFLDHVPADKGGGCWIDWHSFSLIYQSASEGPSKIATGGSCSNTMKGLAALGVSTSLFGKIGPDPMGQFFTDKIVSLGIEPSFILSETPTAQVMCLVTPDKNRTFAVFKGAGGETTEENLTDELFTGIRHMHVEGYMMTNGYIVEESMKRAKAAGITVSFDVASFTLAGRYKERILSLLSKYVDIVFANQDEARALTGTTAEEACVILQEYCPTVVLLAGPEGCIVGSQEGIFREGTTKVKVIDTTGAGDLFASGFLFGYLRGKTLQECARLGNLLGSTVVTVDGAEISEERWEAVRSNIDLRSGVSDSGFN